MNAVSTSTIQTIVRQLDRGFMVYIHKPTGKVIAFPEFDDFADFYDNTHVEMENVELRPDEYLQIQDMTSRELYNTMMDFAQEQEDIEVTRKLVCALRKSDPIKCFMCAIRTMPEYFQDWLVYREDQLVLLLRNRFRRCRKVYN